jgi:hypothetical protein
MRGTYQSERLHSDIAKTYRCHVNRTFPPIGLVEILHCCIHEVIHNLYPCDPEKTVELKTVKCFKKGLDKLNLVVARSEKDSSAIARTN